MRTAPLLCSVLSPAALALAAAAPEPCVHHRARCAEAARSTALARAPRRGQARATVARPRSAHERIIASIKGFPIFLAMGCWCAIGAGAPCCTARNRSARWRPLLHYTQQQAADRRRGGGGWASGRPVAAGAAHTQHRAPAAVHCKMLHDDTACERACARAGECAASAHRAVVCARLRHGGSEGKGSGREHAAQQWCRTHGTARVRGKRRFERRPHNLRQLQMSRRGTCPS